MDSSWDGSVAYRDFVDLDLVSKLIMSKAYRYLLHYEVGNPKFGVRMHLRMAECQVLFWGHCDFELMSRIIVSGAYLLLFEVGITNIVCECILGWRSVTYHFQITVNLTSFLNKLCPDS